VKITDLVAYAVKRPAGRGEALAPHWRMIE
jgi:hypothetical protein